MNLESKDLMIGFWVMYNPNVFIEDEYEPTKECYPIQIKSGDDIDLAIEDCYSPIPLTDEILHKLGFEKQHNIGYVLDDYNGNIVIYDDWNHKLKILLNYTVVFENSYFETISVNTLQLALKSVEFKKEFEL